MKQVTYQTRIIVDEEDNALLEKDAFLLSMIERKLFSDLIKGKNTNDIKSSYIKEFHITARQFNSCRIRLEGKMHAKKKLVLEQIKNLRRKIKGLEKTISRKNSSDKGEKHQKKRKLASCKNKLQKLEKDQQENKIRLCFGGKKLFKSQFHLKENGYQSQEEWLQDWKFARNNSFFLVGSKDESAGNQTSQFSFHGDKFSLKLRLPDHFSKKYILIQNIDFSYGKQNIINVLLENAQRKICKNKLLGQAINFRFKKDRKGWRLFVTIELKKPEWVSKKENGAIGIDINTDHLALSETDRFGNPVNQKIFTFSFSGKTVHQKKALIGDMCKEIVQIAVDTNKPLVIEDLDFREKKASLKEEGTKKYRRMLSSFAYALITSFIQSKAWREKIEVFKVNPAYTSIIGKVKFETRYGISGHQAAALTIARRFLGCSEKLPRHSVKIYNGKADPVTFFPPVRNRKKHEWSDWGKIRGILLAKFSPYFRGARAGPSSSPRKSTLETRNSRKLHLVHANR